MRKNYSYSEIVNYLNENLGARPKPVHPQRAPFLRMLNL